MDMNDTCEDGKWGAEIAISGGQKPDWLHENGTTEWLVNWRNAGWLTHPEKASYWSGITAIRLPADHPHYKQAPSIDWTAPIEAVHEDGRVVAVVLHSGPDKDGDYKFMPRVTDATADRQFSTPEGYVIGGGGQWRIRNLVQAQTPLEYVEGIKEHKFKVGDKIRYIGPQRFGLSYGAIYDCVELGSLGAPMHLDDNGEIRDRTCDDYELASTSAAVTRTTDEQLTHYAERCKALAQALADVPKDTVLGQSGYAAEARAIVASMVEVDGDLVEARNLVECTVHWSPQTDRDIQSGKNDETPEMKIALAAIRRGRALERGE